MTDIDWSWSIVTDNDRYWSNFQSLGQYPDNRTYIADHDFTKKQVVNVVGSTSIRTVFE